MIRALLCAVGFIAGVGVGAPVASLAPARRAPLIDGVIGEDEWCEATAFAGLQKGGNLEPRHGQVWIAMDEQAVYVAVRSELPPDGELITNVKRRGGHVIHDDCIEIWVVPPAEGRPDGTRSKGYFQLLVNSNGVLFDKHWEPGYGLAATAWNVKLEFAGRMHEGMWDAELAIPLGEMGVTELVTPAVWRMNVVRNWKSPWVQANLTASGSFSDVAGMLEIHLDRGAPTIQVRSLGDLQGGRAAVVVSARSPATRRPLVLSGKLQAGDETVLDTPQPLPAPERPGDGTLLAATFTPALKNVLDITVTGPAEKVWYRRQLSFAPEPEHRWTQLAAFRTFALSFDNESVTAAGSVGAGAPIGVKGTPTFVAGIEGKALLVGKDVQIDYDNVGNLPVPCGVSFWLKLLRDRVPREKGHVHPFHRTPFFQTRFKSNGYIGVQDSVYARLQLWLHGFPELTDQTNVMGSFPWQQDRWYHVAFNLGDKGAELFLDGVRLGGSTFKRPLTADELTPFLLGAAGHPNDYVLDEFRIYSRTFSAGEVASLAKGQQVFDGKIAFFPSLPGLLLEATVDPGDLGDEPLLLRMTDVAETTVVLSTAVPRDGWRPTDAGLLQISRTFELPALTDGTYKAWLEHIPGAGAPPTRALQRPVQVEHYPWEGCELGLSNTIIPPFTPLQVKGTTVDCVLRSHDLDQLGLWSQVRSLGEPLLAKPMVLRCVGEGGALSWGLSGLGFTETEPHRVSFEATTQNALLNVHSKGSFDYDGLMEVTLRLIPTSHRPLQRLYLDVPLRPEVATLFHAVGEHIRANPAGAIPDGEGVVWKSRDLPQPNLDNFIAYLWAGGPERGVCWAADWDKDWIHSDERSAVELVREEDAVVLRINLLNGPVVLRRPRTIRFALMASPAKPMPKDWRAWALSGPSPGSGRFNILWPASWGAHYGWGTRYPLDQDFSLIDKITETRLTGEIDSEFIAAWVKRVLEHPGKLVHRDEKSVDAHVRFSFSVARGMHAQGVDTRIMHYSNACDPIHGLPEFPVYGDEWGLREGRHHSSKSFRDYSVYWADQMMRHGMQGIYVDNTFLHAKYSWPTGDAYLDENGAVRPGLGLLSRMRRLIRRLAVMMVEQGREPFVYVHMTNGATLPMLSFAQANLAWEFKYGANDYQDRFTPAYMRTVCTGRQFGTIPTVLGGITGVPATSEEYVRLSRTGMAMVLPHETFFYARTDGPLAAKVRGILNDFRSGEYDAHPYWANALVSAIPADLLVTAYRKPARLLLVIGNMGEAGDFRITLKPDALDGPPRSAVNRETNAAVDVRDQTVHVPLATHDFALIEVTSEQ